MTPDLAIQCDLCVRGVVHYGDWGLTCKFCSGRGSFTLAHLCRALGENESTVRKLLKPRRKMRVKTAYRIFLKLMDIIEPKKEKL